MIKMIKNKQFLLTKVIVLALSVFLYVITASSPAWAVTPPAAADPGAIANCTTTKGVETCFCPKSDPNCGQDTVFKNCEADNPKPITGSDGSFKNCVLTNNLFKRYLNPFIRVLTFMVGLAVAIGIIVGGIIYSTSGGDPQKAAQGKLFIKNAIIALLVYFLLFAALKFLIPGDVLKAS